MNSTPETNFPTPGAENPIVDPFAIERLDTLDPPTRYSSQVSLNRMLSLTPSNRCSMEPLQEKAKETPKDESIIVPDLNIPPLYATPQNSEDKLKSHFSVKHKQKRFCCYMLLIPFSLLVITALTMFVFFARSGSNEPVYLQGELPDENGINETQWEDNRLDSDTYMKDDGNKEISLYNASDLNSTESNVSSLLTQDLTNATSDNAMNSSVNASTTNTTAKNASNITVIYLSYIPVANKTTAPTQNKTIVVNNTATKPNTTKTASVPVKKTPTPRANNSSTSQKPKQNIPKAVPVVPPNSGPLRVPARQQQKPVYRQPINRRRGRGDDSDSESDSDDDDNNNRLPWYKRIVRRIRDKIRRFFGH